jgi:ABC-type branched-subunit amino acid transport system ATPase component
MILVEKLRAGYEGLEVLKGASLRVDRGNALALIGRNGAGKTTLLRSIMGYLRPLSGRILLDGVDVTGWQPHRVARLGAAYVPQDFIVFPQLTVEENLRLAAVGGEGWDLAREAFRLIPELEALSRRRAGQMSGGEQRMLAVARALASRPRILLLDEPLTGLMPLVIRRIVESLARLKEEGAAILIVEQNPHAVLGVVDKVALMDEGKIPWAIDAEDARKRPETLGPVLGLSG